MKIINFEEAKSRKTPKEKAVKHLPEMPSGGNNPRHAHLYLCNTGVPAACGCCK